MGRVRISGLVRAMNHVRHQLAVGIPRQEQEAFRSEVRGYVEQAEAICRHHRAAPKDLPAPSYHAYRFLKDLDLRRLPLPEDGRAPAAAPLRMQGMIRTVAAVQDLLAEAAAQPDPAAAALESATLVDLVRTSLECVESAAAKTGGSPHHLPTPSRRAWQWLCFLNEGVNRQEHVTALTAAGRLAGELHDHPDRPPRTRRLPVVVRFYHSRALAGSRVADGTVQVELNECFIVAPDDVLAAAIRASVIPKATRDRAAVKAFSLTEDAQEVMLALELAGEPAAGAQRTRGRHYDLATVFDRVNRRYFRSAHTRPRLLWSQRHSGRTLGHYQPSADTVMLSVSLDDPGVPDYVVEFVMFHELLHRQLGAQVVNGRVQAHTAAFRAAECRYPAFERTQKWLRQWSR